MTRCLPTPYKRLWRLTRKRSLAGEDLLGRSDEIMGTALDNGRQALDAGNSELAIEQFDLVLGIEPGNATAENGRARAERLPEVIELVRQGDELRRARGIAGRGRCLPWRARDRRALGAGANGA